MPVNSPPELVDLVRRLQLLPSSHLAELTDSLQAAFPEPRALAAELVRRGWLTPYQINQIFRGRADGLILGPYVVLERLGEGGMGEVFKAQHPKLGRVVALKLIRKERLVNPAAVRRFHREVQAAAQLEHPHIVRAFDAGQAGDLHYFVMEYVEGTDLARLVKRDGPLSIERACDYARQAALGLQHAFERGLVHRDIKPANLLLTAKSDVVKVLDMGLARLDRPGLDDASTTLTQEGAVMGTPDYIAPEQARDSHTADIRADLYSLGCTLYFLLTGRVPFPGGSLTEKLLKHTLDEPRPVEVLRPETPTAVAAVVRKLMAKRAEDRCQTPAEAAAALTSLLVAPAAAPEETHTLAEGVAVGSPPAPRDGGDTLETATEEVVRRAAERRGRLAAQGRWRLALYVVGGLLSLGVGVWLLTLFLRLALPPAAPPVAPPPVSPQPVAQPSPAFDVWLKKVAAMPAEGQVEAVKAELKKRNPDFDGKIKPTIENGVVVGLEFLTDEVTDIAPVRALPGLRGLTCMGSWNGKQRLADLSPLMEMKLTYLNCSFSHVTDLSPLKAMKLTVLHCDGAQVSDLSPLKDLKLTSLNCTHAPVSDLSPLKDMKLTTLWCNCTPVSDLSLLKNMPLESLRCDFHPWRDTELLRSMTTLTQINGEPAADFWKEVDAQQADFDAWRQQVAAMKPDEQVEAVKAELKKRNPDFDGKVTPTIEKGVVVGLEFLSDEVTDLAPVRALAGLRTLNCSGSNSGTGRLADLSPLKGMKLTSLWCYHTPVSDLSPLKDMMLTFLDCNDTKVSDLAPLKGIPLKEIGGDFKPGRDSEILRSLTTLETINGKPAAEFWKEFEAPAPPKP